MITFRLLAAAGFVLISFCFGSLTAAAAQVDSLPAKASVARSITDMAEFIRLCETDRNSVGRFYDLPWSDARRERMEKLTRDWQERLQAVDFDKLDQAGRVDWLLLRNKLASELARLDLERRRLAEMEELLPFRKVIQELEQARWRMEPVDAPKAAGAVSVIPDQIKKLRKRIEKGRKDDAKKEKPTDESPGVIDKPNSDASLKVSASLARRTASVVGDLRGSLKSWAGFYDGFLPEFSWWLKKPDEAAFTALDDYAKFLREEIAGLKGGDDEPLVGDPIGTNALADDIAAEMLPYSADELLAIGEAEFVWCEARMKEAAKEMGFGDDWKAALAKVKGGFVPPGQQDSVVLDEARRSIRFLKEHNLVTIPPLAEEIWRMSMLQPEAQKTLPFAAYGNPNMLVAYAKDDMKHEDKLMSMRGNNRHFTRIVVPHELIPGHHLQGFMAARERPYRGAFSTPFFVEGWSLYWEIMLWDLGYSTTPEDRVGMLFWRMHRCARIIVSLKFHLGRMTPQQMVDFLVDRVGHEKLGATSEVRRFIGGAYSPLYQCGYMIGGLQLRALRRELVESGKMTDRQFNDALLTLGPIPVELVRASLLNTPLRRDTQPSWKFAGPAPGAKP
jgi:uncharacterized protein (DUF885 family)